MSKEYYSESELGDVQRDIQMDDAYEAWLDSSKGNLDENRLD